ncbi:MAG TPA: hypothetical protein VFB45_05285 [Pseudolabrys sp.]|nr:hypothetical protein [Pseudolabrys sp.]
MEAWRARVTFHDEAAVLMRTAAANGGTLSGMAFEINASRPPCYNCLRLLPNLAYDLGNPTLTLTDPTGARRIIRDRTIKPAE